nr:uncharacterized protein LOC107127110 [Macaca fascicularis]
MCYVRWALAKAGSRPFHSCGVWCVRPAPFPLLWGWAPRRTAKQQADSPAGEKPGKCNALPLSCCHVKKDVFASPSTMMGLSNTPKPAKAPALSMKQDTPVFSGIWQGP